MSSVGNPHSNNRGELGVKSLKRILRDYVSGTGCLNSDAVTQALLAHANTPDKTLKLSPAQLAYGKTLKDFFPRNVETLTPIPENLLSADAKEQRQRKIRSDQAGVVTSKNGFSNYSVTVSGSGLITKGNRAILRNI